MAVGLWNLEPRGTLHIEATGGRNILLLGLVRRFAYFLDRVIRKIICRRYRIEYEILSSRFLRSSAPCSPAGQWSNTTWLAARVSRRPRRHLQWHQRCGKGRVALS